MTRTGRRRATAGAFLIALVVGGASLAWACTRQPTLTIQPGFGKAGSQVNVNGKAFQIGEPVDIYWNTTDGTPIATASGGSFSVPVIVPDVPDGVYYIVADAPASRAQVSFSVRTNTVAGSEPGPVGDGHTAGSASGAEGASSATGSSSASTGGTNSAGVGEQSGELSFGNAGQPAPTGQSATAPAAAGQTATAPAAQPASSTAANAARSAASAAQTAVGTPAASPAPGATPVPVDDETVSPAPRSATADLWSGFSEGNTGSLMAPGIDAPASSSTTPVAVGVGMLSLGIAALGLGFGAAELRRRRSLAGPNT